MRAGEQALYDNKDGLLDAWAAMWATVATAFKGESHILGVELINEPWVAPPSLLSLLCLLLVACCSFCFVLFFSSSGSVSEQGRSF